jgi:hypothetical protein
MSRSVEAYLKRKDTPKEIEKNKVNTLLLNLKDIDNDKVDALRMLNLYLNGDIKKNKLIKFLKDC